MQINFKNNVRFYFGFIKGRVVKMNNANTYNNIVLLNKLWKLKSKTLLQCQTIQPRKKNYKAYFLSYTRPKE